jgi:hypothetical protein
LRFLVEDLDAVDLRAAWSLVRKPDESVDRLLATFEHGLDCAVPSIRDPAGHPVLLGETTRRVAKEDALDAAVDDNAAADHGGQAAVACPHGSPRRGSDPPGSSTAVFSA